MAEVVLPNLDEYLSRFKPEKVRSSARAALRLALLEFRDRKEFPGVAARFTMSAYGDYRFSHRLTRRGRKIMLDPYVATGGMRSEVLRRKPRIKNGTDEVTGRISINARVMNFLRSVYPTAIIVKSRESVRDIRGPFVRMVKGRAVQVNAHTVLIHKTKYERKKKTDSYAEEWGLRHAETKWIQDRANALLREVLMAKAFTKSGRPRSAFLMQEAA